MFATVLLVPLTSCSASTAPLAPSQVPQEYRDNALDWIEEHALLARAAPEWMRIRQEALALAPHPQTTAETYPAIRSVLGSLGDASAFFLEPRDLADYTGLGVTVVYPRGTVVFVEPRSPAAGAGVREGDLIQTINDERIRHWAADPPQATPGPGLST